MARYLELFAKHVRYILITGQTNGNAAGINAALKTIAPKEPFMIVWSDIILDPNLQITTTFSGCQVGVLNSESRWILENGKLNNCYKEGLGVAGVWVFDDKYWLSDCPESGSFTKWLQNSGIPLCPLFLGNSLDIGTLDRYNAIEYDSEVRSRPYNRIVIDKSTVSKLPLTPDAEKFIQNEINWYSYIADKGFQNIPKIYSSSPLVMERLEATNLFRRQLSRFEKKIFYPI